MLFTVTFFRGNGEIAFSNTFEADDAEKAKATTAIALDGFQQFNNEPEGEASLSRASGEWIGKMSKGFKFADAA